MSQFPPPSTGPYPPQGQANGKTPGVAIASLILGIPGLCFFPFGLLALILGIVGLKKSGTPGVGGRGLALAGTILGGLSVLFAPLIVVFAVFVYVGVQDAKHAIDSAQLRGIQQSMITYSYSNRDQRPGLDSKGRVRPDSAKHTGNSGDGDTVEARYWILLDGGYFTPEYIISPSETAAVTAYQPPALSRSGTPEPVRFKDSGQTNYSYAMLRIKKGTRVNTGGVENPYTVAASDVQRAQEWSASLNSQAVVLSDRNTGSNATTGANSIHERSAGNWSGLVAWGDGHVGYESDQYHETRYGRGMLNRPTTGLADNLFDDQNIGQNSSGPAGSNALMVVDGNQGVFSNDP